MPRKGTRKHKKTPGRGPPARFRSASRTAQHAFPGAELLMEEEEFVQPRQARRAFRPSQSPVHPAPRRIERRYKPSSKHASAGPPRPLVFVKADEYFGSLPSASPEGTPNSTKITTPPTLDQQVMSPELRAIPRQVSEPDKHVGSEGIEGDADSETAYPGETDSDDDAELVETASVASIRSYEDSDVDIEGYEEGMPDEMPDGLDEDVPLSLEKALAAEMSNSSSAISDLSGTNESGAESESDPSIRELLNEFDDDQPRGWAASASAKYMDSDMLTDPSDSDDSFHLSEIEDLDQLMSIQHLHLLDEPGPGGDYNYYGLEDDDFGDDSADELISQLIEGHLDLTQVYRPSGPDRKLKQPLSRRRKERLEAREEARAISFGKLPPLWQKYLDTISVTDVVNEIRDFLYQEAQELRFPPLDKNANWYVLELGKLHGLKTTVRGKNHLKHVIATKTKRSGQPQNVGALKRLTTRRQVFMRTDVDAAKPLRPESNKKLKVSSSRRPKHGEVVGSNAAQISSESFGHRLITEMGWNPGMGLGSAEAVTEIFARVKLNKSGLGDAPTS